MHKRIFLAILIPLLFSCSNSNLPSYSLLTPNSNTSTQETSDSNESLPSASESQPSTTEESDSSGEKNSIVISIELPWL